jgi:GNAT superfamily N-acetyltransferase
MNIRNAQISDLDAIIAMGRKFHGKTIHGQHVHFDEESFRNLCTGLIVEDDSDLIVTDDCSAMAALMTFPSMANDQKLVSTEMWLWSETPGHGIKLLKRLEELARERGAVSMALTSQNNLRDVSPLYKRMGYSAMETIHVKELV